MRFVPCSAWVLALGALGVACGPSDDNVLEGVDAEVSEHIKTVVNVKWTTEKPSTGYVEYGTTKSLGMKTPMSTEESTDHVQPLVGLKPDTKIYYRVVAWDGDAGQSEILSVTTGFNPPGLPRMTVTGTGHDEFILTTLLGTTRAVVILDPDGDVVWIQMDDSELSNYRARLSRDGRGVIYSSAELSGEPSPDSAVVRLSFDGSEREEIPIPLLAHDFVEHADGTIGALVLEDREDEEGNVVRGNKIVEVAPDGTMTDVWTTWDCFDPEVHVGDDPVTGWTFTNALDYDASNDAYLVSIRNFSSIARINRETAECEWVFGSVGATIDFSLSSTTFLHEHQFQLFSGNHLLLMDNEGSLTPNESRVLEYEIDFENNLANEVWSYTADPSVNTYVLGEPTRYPNGDTFINWSVAGQMERVTQDKEVVWKLNSTAGGAFGFNTLAKSLYPQ